MVSNKKLSWDTIPANTRAHCDKVAKFAGGWTYMILKGCIDMETSAKRSNDGSTFKY